MSIDVTPLPPADAIRAFLARGNRLDPSFAWQDVWQETHASMFTVAKSAGFDILSDIYQAVQKSLAEGKTFRDFAGELTPLLQAKGWWGKQQVTDPLTGETALAQLGSTRRLQTIFDVNMRVSYAAGHWASFERNKKARPLLRYVHVEEQPHPRWQHHLWHNTVLPVDDPWWNTHACPNGWGCKCTLQSLSQRDVDRLQRQGETLKFEAPETTYTDWTNKRTGEVTRVPAGIDPGWAYNPGKEGFRQIEQASQQKLDQAGSLFGPLPRAWPTPPATDAELRKLADQVAEGQADWEKTLSGDELAAFADYKGDAHARINAVLRDDETFLEDMEEYDIEAAQAQIDDLSGAMARAKLPRAVTTFRGIPDARAEILFADAIVGDTVSDPGFFSSSLSTEIAAKFGDYTVEVRMPAGTPAAALIHFIPDINHVEYEVLLQAGMPMKIVDKQPNRLIVEVQTAWRQTAKS